LIDVQIPEDRLSAIREAIYGGAARKIEAIKLVREATSCGLKEAKDFVEKTAAAMYASEPEKFAMPPTAKGCMTMLVAAALIVAVAGVVILDLL